MAARTLYDKIWDDHLVDEQPDGTCLIYIDRHLVHEVTSPQAFEGLRLAGRKVARAGEDLAGGRPQRPDHRPHQAQSGSGKRGADRLSGRERQAVRARIFRRVRQPAGHRPHHRARSRALRCPAPRSCAATATPRPMAPSGRWPTASAPRRSSMCWRRRRWSRSGRRICAPWSTASCPPASPPRTSSSPSSARSAPPAAPAMRSNMPARRFRSLSMEGRMTVCNMSVEAGAKAGFIAPDEKVYAYIKDRPKAPKGAAWDDGACATGRR